MSWNRFPTNFVCVGFFVVFFCFVLFVFFRCILFHCFETQWFLTEDKVILLSTVNGVETFTTSPTGKYNKFIGAYLTIIPRARAIDSEAMRARGIIVSVKSN